MLVSVWGLLTALVLAHMPVGQPSLRQAGGLAARTALLGAPVMALLFVLFPRIGAALGRAAGRHLDAPACRTPCAWARSPRWRSTTAIAMRIRFDGAPPPPSQMYFRGPVLTRFDGIEWRPLGLPFAPAGAARPAAGAARRSARRCATKRRSSRCGSPRCRCSRRRPRSRRDRGLPLQPRAKTCSGSPSGRSTSGSASRPRPIRATPSAPSRRSGELAGEPASCRPASTRAPWPGRGRCAPNRAAAASTRPPARALALLQHIRDRRLRATRWSPGDLRPQRRRRVLARPQDRLLRALRRRLRRDHARRSACRRASSPATRAPTAMPVDGFYIVRQSSAHAWAEYWQAGQRLGPRRSRPRAVAPDRIGSSTPPGGRSRVWSPARFGSDEPGAVRQPARAPGRR